MIPLVPNVTVTLNSSVKQDLCGGLAHPYKGGEAGTISHVNPRGTHVYFTCDGAARRMLSISSCDVPPLPRGYPDSVTADTPTDRVTRLASLALLHRYMSLATSPSQGASAAAGQQQSEVSSASGNRNGSDTKPASRRRDRRTRPLNEPTPAKGRELLYAT